MDGLISEIASKRKAMDTNLSSRPTKYMRRGEIERIREEEEEKARVAKKQAEEERKKQEELDRTAKEAARLAKKQPPSKSKSKSPLPPTSIENTPTPDPLADPDASTFNPPPHELTRRLRLKGQPIRLFGETDKDRRLRLRALELMEERGHGGGQNDFRKAMEGVESVEKELRDKMKEGKDKSKKTEDEDVGVLDLTLVKTAPEKLHPLIYHALKGRLKEWEEAMDERPDNIKRTTQGKLAAATQVQSAEYLKPMFKQLRSRTLPADMLPALAEIVHHMQARQYQKANDAYLRLSIGNAPWPIGVTMVGIHERSAREKISSDQVAHVLNDEVSRKYIQSLKRLLTFSQTKYPPEDISQLMG